MVYAHGQFFVDVPCVDITKLNWKNTDHQLLKMIQHDIQTTCALDWVGKFAPLQRDPQNSSAKEVVSWSNKM